MTTRDDRKDADIPYTRICRRLRDVGMVIGVAPKKGSFLEQIGRDRNKRDDHSSSVLERFSLDLRLASIRLTPADIEIAGRALAVIVFATLLSLCALALVLNETSLGLPLAISTAIAPLLAKGVLTSYPAKLAARRTELILKHSVEAVNLMIMSLRHEPSITNAITFASARDNVFSRELKGCTWSVIMGKCESFEEALLRLGNKWSRLGDDLKTSLNSLVISSREATQDGRRRALDRANQAMIAGGKRRIEEYAMSLSTPSMLIFGLGILLPLMVGSFLPMLSWNLWSMDSISADEGLRAENRTTPQMVFVMNLLFPAVAYLVAIGAVSNHPLEQERGPTRRSRTGLASWSVVLIVSGSLCATVWITLDDSVLRSVLLLFSAVGPSSAWLLMSARSVDKTDQNMAGDLEDVLFRTGARMLEGENFESSFHGAAKELSRGRSNAARVLSLRNILAANGQEDEPFLKGASFGVRNAAQGLRITRQAAAKDETAAGTLAMDLASYLKDLRDLEGNLRNRIRPTISMMKTTALVLAPVVLGVTYAIYLSLASMLGGQGGAANASTFFLVLGVFLAQMDAVVAYFVWGIEGKRGVNRLAASIGGYVIVSELAYSATALIASG